MTQKIFILVLIMLVAVGHVCSGADTPEQNRVTLPKPQIDGGKPLMQVLSERATSRSFSSKPIPDPVLSNLLWAAFGINRPESGKRTAPSARNWQEIDIYLATADGVFRYDAEKHALIKQMEKDIRSQTGMQSFVADAPLNLIYVADYSRMGDTGNANKDFYSAADTGFISQNVYLFCASEGMATVVRGLVDRDALKDAMNLKPDQKVILAQTVGYPGETP